MLHIFKYKTLINIFYLDSAIDFLNHYRLVDPMNLDSYAKAFVVEDTDFDTVLNSSVLLAHIFVFTCILSTCWFVELVFTKLVQSKHNHFDSHYKNNVLVKMIA